MIAIIIVIITGIGINPSLPFPILTKASGNFDIGVPSVNTKVAPLNIVIVAKVTMNACNFPFDTNKPFINPTAIPITATTIIAKNTFPVDLTIEAPTAPLIAKVDPTDKSIPPVKITKVIPIAMIALTETCVNTLVILDILKKFGVTIVITIHNNTSPIRDLYLDIFALTFAFIM